MYDVCFKIILNFKKKKIKNIPCMYDGRSKIDFKFKKKLKIFNICMMDVLKLILNLKKNVKTLNMNEVLKLILTCKK